MGRPVALDYPHAIELVRKICTHRLRAPETSRGLLSLDDAMSIQPEPVGPGPRSLAGIVSEMFRQYVRNIVSITIIAAVITVPLVAAGILAFGPEFMTQIAGVSPEGEQSMSAGHMWALMAYIVLYMLGFLAMSGAVAEAAGQSLAGRSISIGRSYAVALRRLPSMLGASFFAGLAAGLPLSLSAMLAGSTGSSVSYVLLVITIVLAVYLVVRLMFALFAALFEQKPSVNAIVRSWTLVSGAMPRTFALLLVIGLTVGLIQLGLQSVGTLAPGLDALLVSLVVAPLTVIGDLLIYLDLRARKEGHNLESLVSELDALSGEAPQTRP